MACHRLSAGAWAVRKCGRSNGAARPGFIFDLRDRSSGESGGSRPTITLMLPHLELIARLTGTLHAYAPHPVGGWSGDTNTWVASDYFIKLVNTISAHPSEAA